MKKDKVGIIRIIIYSICVLIALPFGLLNIVSAKITHYILLMGEKAVGINYKETDYMKYCEEGEN